MPVGSDSTVSRGLSEMCSRMIEAAACLALYTQTERTAREPVKMYYTRHFRTPARGGMLYRGERGGREGEYESAACQPCRIWGQGRRTKRGGGADTGCALVLPQGKVKVTSRRRS